MRSGQVAAAALDVFETEPLPADSPLRELPNLVLTPHLGASTAEAQESVGIEIAQAIRAASSKGQSATRSTCRISMRRHSRSSVRICASAKSSGVSFPSSRPSHAEQLNINYSGKVNEVDTTAITRSVLKGFLQKAGGIEVNEVNAPAYAESLGLKINETRLSAVGDYTDLLELSGRTAGQERLRGRRVLRRDPAHRQHQQSPVEARPHGVVLVLENTDRPGMVGRVGTLLGDHGVNIATMSLSRNEAGGTALTVLNLDTRRRRAARRFSAQAKTSAPPRSFNCKPSGQPQPGNCAI